MLCDILNSNRFLEVKGKTCIPHLSIQVSQDGMRIIFQIKKIVGCFSGIETNMLMRTSVTGVHSCEEYDNVSSSMRTMHKSTFIPRIHKVSFGHLLSIDAFNSVQ